VSEQASNVDKKRENQMSEKKEGQTKVERDKRDRQYLCDKKATRGYAVAPCPIERTSNLVESTPVIK